MKRLCFVSLLIFWSTLSFANATQKSAIVYYGHDISWPMLGVHDYIILEPSHVDTHTHGFKRYCQRVYAYVSIGEVEKDRPWFKRMKKEWLIGHNSVWKAEIVDLADPKYRRFMIENVIDPLYKKGFQNFFLDTVDVCDRFKEMKKQVACREGSVALIRDIKRSHPNAGIIINRGFHIFEEVKNDLDAVLFESYYKGLKSKKYAEVSEKDRVWLDRMLKPIQKSGVPVIAVDYVENPHSDEADRISRKLLKKGFIPYIADKDLSRYGHTAYSVLKREVLIFYNGSTFGMPFSSAHLYTSMPLEYQGYVPILYDITKGLPTGHLEDRFAGVIFEVDRAEKRGERVVKWIKKYANRGLKSMIVGDNFPFAMSEDYFAPLGIDLKNTTCSPQNPKRLIADRGFFYEMRVPLQDEDTYFQPKGDALALLAYKNRCGETNVLAAKTWWGGYVANQAWSIQYGNDVIWIADPFKIFDQVLDLKPLPVPDPTTENGLRILFTHIDGDGIMNRAEWNEEFSGQVILNEILKKYPIPHSVSVVGAEIVPNGLYPKLSPELIKIVRQIYALPNVEAASHTFSHPFEWEKIDPAGNLLPQYRLNVPGYKFSLDYELGGFLQYINNNLLPKGKPKARTIFWSGDCLPPQRAVAYVYRHNLLNINGGDTYITKDHPWLSYIAPFGLRHGYYWQIYTGEQNENVYTNDFHGPYWGFVKAIQTYQMTNTPRRFKPIDIYYHFYSGSKRASLNALKRVFDWALRQPVMPLYTTEYIPKAMDFYAASIAERGSNGWIAAGLDDVRTLRFEGYHFPDLVHSEGVAGYRQDRNVTYIHFDGRDRVALNLADREPEWSVERSNGRISQLHRHKGHWTFTLQAHVPLKGRLIKTGKCRIRINPSPDKKSVSKDRYSFEYRTQKRAMIDVICQ